MRAASTELARYSSFSPEHRGCPDERIGSVGSECPFLPPPDRQCRRNNKTVRLDSLLDRRENHRVGFAKENLNMNSKRGGFMLAGLVLILGVASGAWAASEKVLYAFQG